MSNVNNINPQDFAKAVQLFQQADTDGVKGLQGKEIEVFKNLANEANLQEESINAILGLHFTETTETSAAGAKHSPAANAPKKLLLDNDFLIAMKYFIENGGLNSEQSARISDFTEKYIVSDLSFMLNRLDEFAQESSYISSHPELFNFLEKLVDYSDSNKLTKEALLEARNMIDKTSGTYTKKPEPVSVQQELNSLVNKTVSFDFDGIIETAERDNDDINKYLTSSWTLGQGGVLSVPAQLRVNYNQIAEETLGMSLDEFKEQYADMINGLKNDAAQYIITINKEDLSKIEDFKAVLEKMFNFKNAVEAEVFDIAQQAVGKVQEKREGMVSSAVDDIDALEQFSREQNPTENMVPEMKYSGTRFGFEQAVKIEYSNVVTEVETPKVEVNGKEYEVGKKYQEKGPDGKPRIVTYDKLGNKWDMRGFKVE